MPRKSKLNLQPLNLGAETLGQRIARFRKERGFTQIELAERMGLIQGLVSDYELDKLRPYPEMLVRFAHALEVSTDELLGVNNISKKNGTKPSLKILRRLKKIEELAGPQQNFLLKTIDTFLKGYQR